MNKRNFLLSAAALVLISPAQTFAQYNPSAVQAMQTSQQVINSLAAANALAAAQGTATAQPVTAAQPTAASAPVLGSKNRALSASASSCRKQLSQHRVH